MMLGRDVAMGVAQGEIVEIAEVVAAGFDEGLFNFEVKNEKIPG